MANENQTDISLKRTIYKNNRMSIDFFMYAPKALFVQNSYTLNVNPILLFKHINTNVLKDEKTYVGDNSYKMTQKNHFKMITFFNTIVSWFYDDKLKDLFLVTDNEELVFNSDYKHIYATLAKNKFDSGLLKAVPSLIMFEDQRYEGIYLYINRLENLVMLTKEEVEIIFHIVKEFNFMNEAASMLTLLSHVEKTGNISTDQFQWNKSVFNGSYSSPFDKK